MIIVFPMLTDENVSQNILPGVCKALEKFILIYKLDDLIKISGLSVITTGTKIAHQLATKQKREGYNILEQFDGTKSGQSQTKPPGYNEDEDEDEDEDGKNPFKGGKSSGPGKAVFDTIKGLRDMGTVKVELPKEQALSVEPTYLTVQTSIGTRLLGVKVIPCPVKTSRYTLAELLTADVSLGFFDSLIYRISRKAIRAFWSMCRALRIPFVKDQVISGDPEKDILWAQSYHKRNVFCLLNYADFTDSSIFKNQGGIFKLHSLGWNSFIAADEVSKRALFCMKEFHGLCSSVPYAFIYSSLGKEHNKAFETLESLTKSASPFFKTKISQKRLYSESKNLVEDYLRKIGG